MAHGFLYPFELLSFYVLWPVRKPDLHTIVQRTLLCNTRLAWWYLLLRVTEISLRELKTEHAEIAGRNRSGFPSQGPVARAFPRKIAVLNARNSQTKIAIASDGHSQP